jgi:hypothetical protein
LDGWIAVMAVRSKAGLVSARSEGGINLDDCLVHRTECHDKSECCIPRCGYLSYFWTDQVLDSVREIGNFWLPFLLAKTKATMGCPKGLSLAGGMSACLELIRSPKLSRKLGKHLCNCDMVPHQDLVNQSPEPPPCHNAQHHCHLVPSRSVRCLLGRSRPGGVQRLRRSAQF